MVGFCCCRDFVLLDVLRAFLLVSAMASDIIRHCCGYLVLPCRGCCHLLVSILFPGSCFVLLAAVPGPWCHERCSDSLYLVQLLTSSGNDSISGQRPCVSEAAAATTELVDMVATVSVVASVTVTSIAEVYYANRCTRTQTQTRCTCTQQTRRGKTNKDFFTNASFHTSAFLSILYVCRLPVCACVHEGVCVDISPFLL